MSKRRDWVNWVNTKTAKGLEANENLAKKNYMIRELVEITEQARNLHCGNKIIQRARSNSFKTGAKEMAVVCLPGKPEAFFIDVVANLKAIRNRRALLGYKLLDILDKAEEHLSIRDFCMSCSLDPEAVATALCEYDSAEESGGRFLWLLLENGVESAGKDFNDGVIFNCILESVLTEVRDSSALRTTYKNQA